MVEEILAMASPILATFSVEEAIAVLLPLVLFVAGTVIYAVFIFTFYRFIAKRDIIKLDISGSSFGKFIKRVFYLFEYVLLFPLISFASFMVLSVLLAFLAKGQTVDSIILASVALVSAVRVTAYYSEDLSKDLAKMLPFALLGIFLVDVSYFSLDTSISLLTKIPAAWHTLVYYLGFAIVLEFVLRIGHGIARWAGVGEAAVDAEEE